MTRQTKSIQSDERNGEKNSERKYTLEEWVGWTNGESNYWKIHENDDGHTRSLVTIDEHGDFESWEDVNYLWFNLVDRGITFCILKDDMDLFMAHFGQTAESKQFKSWTDKSHWNIQFLSVPSGFTLTFPVETLDTWKDMDSLWMKLTGSTDMSTYEQYVTHIKNNDEVHRIIQEDNTQ